MVLTACAFGAALVPAFGVTVAKKTMQNAVFHSPLRNAKQETDLNRIASEILKNDVVKHNSYYIMSSLYNTVWVALL